jgi:glycerophosphoryl diester phosphodiesterase
MTVVIGHRWAAWHKLENTISSFQTAIDMWVNMLETDIWQIHDGSYVIFHDSLIDRISKESWYIYDFTSNDLDHIVLNNQDHILPLDTFLQRVKDKAVQIYFEIKQPNTADSICEKIREVLPYAKYTIGSFFHHEIHELKKSHPEVTTGLLFEWVFDNLDQYLATSNADIIWIWFESCDDYIVNTVKNSGKKLVLWTLDEVADIEKSLTYTPRGLVSNFPDRVISIVASKK